MVCTVRLEKLQLEHTDFFLQRGVFRTQMGILRPHAHTRYVVPKEGWRRCGGPRGMFVLGGTNLFGGRSGS